MRQGFIKCHRRLTEWEWYKNANTFRVFIHLLLIAQFEESNLEGVTIPVGSCVCTAESIAIDLGLSRQNVRTAINHLKSTNEITTKSCGKFSIITIVNWDIYQTTNPQTNHGLTTNQPRTNHIKECKEYKNEKNVKKEKKEVLPSYREVYSTFGFSETVNGLLEDWIQMRKLKKNPPTNRAIKLVCQKISKVEESVQIKVLEKSIECGWSGVFLPDHSSKASAPKEATNEDTLKYGGTWL